MFGTVIDKLDTFFGREFLISQFLPFLIVFCCNATFAYFVFPSCQEGIQAAVENFATAKGAIYVLLGLAATAAMAYVLAPFGRLTTVLLEGEWLLADPRLAPIGQALVLAQALSRQQLIKREYALFQARAGLPSVEEIKQRLGPIADRGNIRRRRDDPGAITEVENRISSLRYKKWLRLSVTKTEIEEVIDAISEAFLRNSVNICQDLNLLYIEFINEIIPYVTSIAEVKQERAAKDANLKFSQSELAPTRLGNSAAALREYCRTRYGIDFETFWPRFLMILSKDDKLNSAIASAKIKLDFAALSLALLAVSVTVWTIVLLCLSGPHIWLFLVVAFGLPLIVLLLAGVHARYLEFAETVRAAIDIGRFNLITALHLPLPATLEEEQEIWDNLGRLFVYGPKDLDITYKNQ